MWEADQQTHWTACCQNNTTADRLTNRVAHLSSTLTNKRRQWRTPAEHCRFKSGPPLMRGLDIHKNISVSVCVLTLGISSLALTWHRTNSSQVTREQSHVHRRWASCLRPKACLLWSLNKGLSLLHTWITLIGTSHPTSKFRWSAKTSTRLSASQMLRQGRSCISPQTVF